MGRKRGAGFIGSHLVDSLTKSVGVGDIVKTDIDISLLQSFGWAPKKSLDQSVRDTLRWLVSRYGSI